MKTNVLQEIVDCCRQRESSGDRPRKERPNASMLEDAVLYLAAYNERLRKMLAEERKMQSDQLSEIGFAATRIIETVRGKLT